MSDPRDPTLASTTVLDRVRPTVVRRRVYETAELRPEGPAPLGAVSVGPALESEAPPPSSLDVTRAAAHEEELHRKRAAGPTSAAREIPAPNAEASAGPPSTRQPTLVVGRSIRVAELARRMSVALEELVEALVNRGFFSATPDTPLRRESVRNVAEAFGWRVESPPADVLLEHMCPAR